VGSIECRSIKPENFKTIHVSMLHCISYLLVYRTMKSVRHAAMPVRTPGFLSWIRVHELLFEFRINIAQSLNYEARGEHAYRNLLEISPGNLGALIHFGEYYSRKGDLENAILVFQRAIACPGLNND